MSECERPRVPLTCPDELGLTRRGQIAGIYWFVPQGGSARTFDVILSGLDPRQPDYDIQAVDPLAGRRLDDGSIIAPKMTFEDASAKYRANI